MLRVWCWALGFQISGGANLIDILVGPKAMTQYKEP